MTSMQDTLWILFQARATNTILLDRMPRKQAMLLYSCTAKRCNIGLQHNFAE